MVGIEDTILNDCANNLFIGFIALNASKIDNLCLSCRLFSILSNRHNN